MQIEIRSHADRHAKHHPRPVLFESAESALPLPSFHPIPATSAAMSARTSPSLMSPPLLHMVPSRRGDDVRLFRSKRPQTQQQIRLHNLDTFVPPARHLECQSFGVCRQGSVEGGFLVIIPRSDRAYPIWSVRFPSYSSGKMTRRDALDETARRG
jgi:hypothetical protein